MYKRSDSRYPNYFQHPDFPTVQYPREIHLKFGSPSLLPRYLKFTAVRASTEHNVSQSVIATASDNPVVGYAIGRVISFSFELMSVSYPHCLRAQYQPVVICAIFAYCLWVAGVLRPKDYVTFNAVNSGISSPCVPLNTAVNNYPCKKRVKRNCWYDYLTIRITVICSNSPLFSIQEKSISSLAVPLCFRGI